MINTRARDDVASGSGFVQRTDAHEHGHTAVGVRQLRCLWCLAARAHVLHARRRLTVARTGARNVASGAPRCGGRTLRVCVVHGFRCRGSRPRPLRVLLCAEASQRSHTACGAYTASGLDEWGKLSVLDRRAKATQGGVDDPP
jgi:hypothetical protein